MNSHLRLWASALLAVSALAAAEHHGQVTFNGFPVPGATVTAARGGRKFAAITDAQGFYSFADLADGAWRMEVQMFGFANVQRDVAGAPMRPLPNGN